MIRQYIKEDKPILEWMLYKEGLGLDEMEFEDHTTFVYDDGKVKGFFTFRENEHGYPCLTHFCVHRQYRGTEVTWRMIRAFKKIIRERGAVASIVILKENMSFVNKVVERYFKKGPYAVENGYKFYFVEV